jgi:hypothetical protein
MIKYVRELSEERVAVPETDPCPQGLIFSYTE